MLERVIEQVSACVRVRVCVGVCLLSIDNVNQITKKRKLCVKYFEIRKYPHQVIRTYPSSSSGLHLPFPIKWHASTLPHQVACTLPPTHDVLGENVDTPQSFYEHYRQSRMTLTHLLDTALL